MPHYSVFGLAVLSDLPLPELVAAEAAAEPDIAIRLGPVEPGSGQLVSVGGVGRYGVAGGRTITVEREAGASDRDVRLFLLGSVLGVLLLQRGWLPLHACGVEIAGRAVLFAGASGAGKSTLAAYLEGRGHAILADDVCPVRIDGAKGPVLTPGLPRIRLWADAADALGRDVRTYERVKDDFDKFTAPMIAPERRSALPLSAIYCLEAGEGFAIERLRGAAAMEALMANTYRGEYIRSLGASSGHFAQCVDLAGRTPVHRLRRPLGFDRLPAVMDAVIAHAEGVAA